MKRYYMTEGGALCERTDDHGRALIPHTIIARADACDRLNALEAENAELRKALKFEHDDVCEHHADCPTCALLAKYPEVDDAGRTALAGGME